MLNEAVIIAKNGFPQRKQDLFMEQAALCGILGYREFFTSDWLEPILSWQDEVFGCYRGELVFESEVKLRDGVKSRRKREERPLSHGCLCHRTTVAGSAGSVRPLHHRIPPADGGHAHMMSSMPSETSQNRQFYDFRCSNFQLLYPYYFSVVGKVCRHVPEQIGFSSSYWYW